MPNILKYLQQNIALSTNFNSKLFHTYGCPGTNYKHKVQKMQKFTQSTRRLLTFT